MGKPDNQPAAEKSMIKPYKEEKPYDLASLVERGRGQKVGPIDRGVRRSIYVFA